MKPYSPETAFFCLFFVSLWFGGAVSEELLQCRLLGELLIGVIFGNLDVGALLPTDKTILVLAGEIGVLGLVFEAGLGTDFRRILRVGPRATLVALVGTVVPLATGFGLIYWILHQSNLTGISPYDTTNRITEALASGAALASTSIACAVSLMKQQGLLETQTGILITTAAMIDDVVSLILLGIVAGIGGSESSSASTSSIGPMTIMQPILASVGVILVGFLGCLAAVKLKRGSPSIQAAESPVAREIALDALGSDVESAVDKESIESADRSRVRRGPIQTHAIRMCNNFLPTAKLASMLVVGVGYSILAEYLGSSRLLGAFVAGVFFSQLESFAAYYTEQVTNRLQPAMTAVFFATIGFAIPITEILDPILFGWGVLYAVVASLSKLLTGLLAPSSYEPREESVGGERALLSERWMVGTAMVARGELGLLMIQQALVQGVVGQAVMVITTWSIVLCTIVGIGALSVVMRGMPPKSKVQFQE